MNEWTRQTDGWMDVDGWIAKIFIELSSVLLSQSIFILFGLNFFQ